MPETPSWEEKQWVYRLSIDTVIVARITYTNGEVFDWAAYAGSGEPYHVADHGDKVAKELAAVCFPTLPIEKWRP